jgi:hypothetical protein
MMSRSDRAILYLLATYVLFDSLPKVFNLIERFLTEAK